MPDLSDRVSIEGHDPCLPFHLPLGEAAATALGACGAAAAWLWAEATGESQTACVSVREAAAQLDAYRRLQIVEGAESRAIPSPERDGLSEPHQCADGRWIHLNGSQPHFRDATLGLLNCGRDATAVSKAVVARESLALEEQLAALGVPAAVYRTLREWTVHEQGRLLAGTPLVEIGQVTPGPVMPYIRAEGAARMPLDGIRVADLSRVLAGPTAVKLLSLLGAEALRLTRPGTFEEQAVLIDTGFGKRSAWLDVGRPDQRGLFNALVREADVLVENAPFGSMAAKGISPRLLARENPGLIYVSLNCYGHAGPWRSRRGYEPHADAGTGLRTQADPCQAPDPFFRTISDYTTGWLAALGVLAALHRRSVDGGSYHVRVSLARTAMWIQSFRAVDATAAVGLGDTEEFMMITDTAFGRLRHSRPPLRFSSLPADWTLPPAPLGYHEPSWRGGSLADQRA
jgi:crotonobetainyl-CoA:carnitine CoA-transferase CaiB-like acyl-CoA transferase